MDSPNILDLDLQFAGCPLNLRVGPEAYHLRKSWNVGRHCNADYEVHILLSGGCMLEVGDRQLSFSAADAVLIPPGVYHSLYRLSEDFEWFCFSFFPTRQDFFKTLLHQLPSATTFTLSPEVMTLCNLLLKEMSTEQSFQEDSVRSLFTQLLVATFRGAHLTLSAQAPVVLPVSIRTTIIDNFFSPSGLALGTEDELADMLHLSRRQLNRVLIQNYGMGYRQKMLQTRMEYAGNLLRTTDQKVGQIGFLAGYTVESSFYKAFQSYYNMTPRQYRDFHRKKE